MVRLGVFLIFIGFGSLLMPLMGRQFVLMSLFNDAQPAAGIIVGGLGILFVVLGVTRNKSKQAQAQMNYAYNPNMPQQQAPTMQAPAQVGNCQRCAQPIWAGEASCRSCGAPANLAPQR